MAFSFTLLAAVASVKDVCYDLAFDFLQEAIVTKGFFPVFFAGVFSPCMYVGEHKCLLVYHVSGWSHAWSLGWTPL